MELDTCYKHNCWGHYLTSAGLILACPNRIHDSVNMMQILNTV